MTRHEPPHRNREPQPRRAETLKSRHVAKNACAAVVARNGIDGVTRAAVRALGAGEAEFWGEDGCEGISPATGQKTGVCDDE